MEPATPPSNTLIQLFEQLTCPIEKQLLKKAVSLTPCMHKVNETAAFKLLNCPVCQSSISSYYPDPIIRETMLFYEHKSNLLGNHFYRDRLYCVITKEEVSFPATLIPCCCKVSKIGAQKLYGLENEKIPEHSYCRVCAKFVSKYYSDASYQKLIPYFHILKNEVLETIRVRKIELKKDQRLTFTPQQFASLLLLKTLNGKVFTLRYKEELTLFNFSDELAQNLRLMGNTTVSTKKGFYRITSFVMRILNPYFLLSNQELGELFPGDSYELEIDPEETLCVLRPGHEFLITTAPRTHIYFPVDLQFLFKHMIDSFTFTLTLPPGLKIIIMDSNQIQKHTLFSDKGNLFVDKVWAYVKDQTPTGYMTSFDPKGEFIFFKHDFAATGFDGLSIEGTLGLEITLTK